MKTDEFTVNQAAEKFGRTTGRIRQICLKHNLGTCHRKRIRLLTATDMGKIQAIISEFGWNK